MAAKCRAALAVASASRASRPTVASLLCERNRAATNNKGANNAAVFAFADAGGTGIAVLIAFGRGIGMAAAGPVKAFRNSSTD